MASSEPVTVRYQFPPMELRDYFAGQALVGILANVAGDLVRDASKMDDPRDGLGRIGRLAYVMADAMLKARDE